MTTQDFLTAVGHEGAFTSQVFKDHTSQSIFPKLRHGTLAELEPKLRRDNEKGAGIYFCVNRTDLKGRRYENIQAVTNFFADLDGSSLFDEYPLEPTAIVESSPERYHLYWRVSNVPLDDFSDMQRFIAALLGGDSVINDLPRVMRLPGFYHNKREPFMTRIIELNPKAKYSYKRFRDAFSPPEKKKGIPPLPAAAQAYLSDSSRSQDNRSLLYQRVASAGAGYRNVALFKVAAALKNDVARGELNESQVRQELQLAAQAAGLTVEEIIRTIDSAFRYPAK